ncbi:MAG: ATP-binding cassette domain-containing protein [Bacteroidetes bacterium]|nr:ATP-binding cassette domain-containing protein [Bacteroidota bacterium]
MKPETASVLSGYKILIDLIGHQNRGTLAKMFLLSLIALFLEVLGVFLLFLIVVLILDPDQYDYYINHIFKLQVNLTGSTNLRVQNIVGILVLFLLKIFFAYRLNLGSVKLAFEIAEKVTEDKYEKRLREKIYFTDESNVSKWINELYSVTETFPLHLIFSMVTFFSELLFLFLCVIILSWYSFQLVVLFLFSLIPVVLVTLLLRQKKLRELGKRDHSSMNLFFQKVINTAHNFVDITLSGKQNYFKEQLINSRNDLYANRKQMYTYRNLVHIRLVELGSILSVVALALYTLKQGTTQGVTSFALFSSFAFRMIPSINRLANSYSIFNSFSYLIRPEKELSEIEKSRIGAVPIHFNNQIQFVRVSFTYPGVRKVLDSCNFSILKGSWTGISGKSGNGKTTLAKLLTGLLEPDSGEILIDNNDLRTVRKSWQNIIAYVGQEPQLLMDTVMRNVAFGENDPNEERVVTALKKVDLYDWVLQQSNALNHVLIERGGNLSGGQRQRLSIARALYAEAEVFIFDETTNSLDEQSKGDILDLILRLKNDEKTIITISHDASVLAHCDSILYVENGKVSF